MKICRISRPPVNPVFDKFVNGRDHMFKRIEQMGHEVYEFEVKPVRIPSLYLAYLLGIALSPFQFLKIKPDMILADKIESGIAALWIKYIFNVPLVFAFIDDYSLIAGYDRIRFRYWILKYLEKVIPRFADGVITVNLEINKFCLDMGVPKSKLSIVSNGVDTAMFKPGIGSEEMKKKFNLQGYQVVLFVGRITRYYKLETIAKAIPLVLKAHPRVRFLFVGDGNNVKSLKDLSHQLKTEQSLIFGGFRPPEEIPQIINLSDICVFPLPCSSALAIFEYMACAKPIVMPRGNTEKMSSSEEMLPEDCTLRVKDSPEGFAQGVSFLLSNQEIARRMGKKARELTVKSYDWNMLAKK